MRSQVPDSTLADQQAAATLARKKCVVGAVVLNSLRQAFVHKRTADRRMFRGAWDIIGGHVERGETLLVALQREVREETGWALHTIEELIFVHDWTPAGEDIGRREFDFVVTVTGDLAKPMLEARKVSEYRWIGRKENDLLLENPPPDDRTVRTIVERALYSRQWQAYQQ